MGQDRAQQWPRRSLSNTAGMAWECCACSAVTFGTCAALAFCSEAEASEAPETSQHKQHDMPQEQADVPPCVDGPCGLGSVELPASRPGHRPVPRGEAPSATFCSPAPAAEAPPNSAAPPATQSSQRSLSSCSCSLSPSVPGLRRHPPMSRGAPVFHQLAYLTVDPTGPTRRVVPLSLILQD